MERKLLFIYNADSGLFTGISGYFRRTFSPDTYECNLDKVTHGPLGMKGPWKRFVRKLDLPAEFLHRDTFVAKHPKTFIKAYPKAISYPCVVVRKPDSVEILLTAEEINGAKTHEELMDIITGKLVGAK